jgi:hypothetical protein
MLLSQRTIVLVGLLRQDHPTATLLALVQVPSLAFPAGLLPGSMCVARKLTARICILRRRSMTCVATV